MFTKRALLAGMAATGFGLAAARPASAQNLSYAPGEDGSASAAGRRA
jgi:hypothetical protein